MRRLASLLHAGHQSLQSRRADKHSRLLDVPPASTGPIETWLAFRRDPLAHLCRTAQEQGDVVKLRVGPFAIVLLRHPDAVQHVLVDNNRNYDKNSYAWGAMKLFLGSGLLTSDGAFWRRQRRIMQPAFHRQRIAGFADTMVSLTLELLEQWKHYAATGETFDMAAQMSGLALRIVSRTLLSTDVVDARNQVAQSVGLLNAYIDDKMTNPLMLPLGVPTPHNLRARKAAAHLDGIILDIIEQRRRNGGAQDDLLSMLMQATDADTGEQMSDAQLRDEALTIFVAGHETTANALSWTLYLLSQHPEARRRLTRELHEVLGTRPPTLADIADLPYLQRVVKESLRLHPPAWMTDRHAIDDDEVSGYRIPAGSIVGIAPYVTHRDARFWPNPEGFDPDRFDPELEKSRPRYAYFPFGGGPRLCIGNNFALMEAQLVLATLLTRFEAEIVPGYPVVLDPRVTLRPQNGIRMRIRQTP